MKKKLLIIAEARNLIFDSRLWDQLFENFFEILTISTLDFDASSDRADFYYLHFFDFHYASNREMYNKLKKAGKNVIASEFLDSGQNDPAIFTYTGIKDVLGRLKKL